MNQLTREQVNLALNVGAMPAEKQNLFFKSLTGILTDGEIRAFQVVVAYFRLNSNPQRDKAMCDSLAKQIYEQFTV